MAGPALDKIAGLECCADVTVVDLGFGSALVGSGQRLSLVLHGGIASTSAYSPVFFVLY